MLNNPNWYLVELFETKSLNQGAVDIKVVHMSLEMLQSSNNETENEWMSEGKSNFSWWSQKLLCRMSLCFYSLFRHVVIWMTSLLQLIFEKIMKPTSMDCFAVCMSLFWPCLMFTVNYLCGASQVLLYGWYSRVKTSTED